MFLRLLLFFAAAFACCAGELTVAFDGSFCRVGNTHSAGQTEYYQSDELLLVSKVRDLFLVPVGRPSNCILNGKKLLNLSAGSRVKLERGGQEQKGRIAVVDEFYYQRDTLDRIHARANDLFKLVFNLF